MEEIVSCRVRIKNPQGLHMRPAQLFVQLAGQFECRIEVINDARRADGKSLIELCTLCVEEGTELEIEASGPDAATALEALAELVQKESVDEMLADQQ